MTLDPSGVPTFSDSLAAQFIVWLTERHPIYGLHIEPSRAA